jgi:hypothetical protein
VELVALGSGGWEGDGSMICKCNASPYVRVWCRDARAGSTTISLC